MASKGIADHAAEAVAAPSGEPAAPADVLDAALRMIAGFQHRHKNQHRLSTYWWAPFQQLRRHATKVRDQLRQAAAKQAAQTTTKRAGPAGPVGSNGQPNAAAAAQARWMLQTLVPKAYLAFSRLMVDKQFAQLGLLLLGLLAQIRAALVEVTGDDQTDRHEEQEQEQQQESAEAARTQSSAQTKRKKASTFDTDLGEAVTREDEAGEAEEKPQKPQKLEKLDGSQKPSKSDKLPDDRKKTDGRKKNKRRRGGDEFDNLFSGLL